MNKLINIIILFFILFYIYSDESDGINKYDLELLIKIKSGHTDELIGYDIFGLPHHTRAFAISKNENVYVCDPYNGRIQVYDIYFNYKKTIKNEKLAADGVAFADKIILDNNENLILIDHSEGLYKYTISGERLIKISRSELPDSVLYSLHCYPFGDNIAFYNMENELHLINKDGTITPVSIVDLLSNINEHKESVNIKKSRMYIYIKTNGLYYYSGKIFPKDYYDFNNLCKTILKDKKIAINTELPEPEPDMFIEQFLIGYDNDNNIYWQGYWKNFNTRVIAVFSKELVLLDLFTYKLAGNNDTYEALAPNGDIYIMQPEPEGVYFYKITRRW